MKLSQQPTKVEPTYSSKKDYKNQLKALQKEMDELQQKMYAHNKYGLLVVFQAMDAAGKDSTMSTVFNRVNPMGVSFSNFKRPSENELDHDYLWRCYKELPQRGTIKVFNRSYYEEVLVVKVHPGILTSGQKLPEECKIDLNTVWKNRYSDIKNFESYLSNNGIKVVKFFLNVSKEEQARRLISRINTPEKNWKFEEGDIKERNYWADYQAAYETAINKTNTKDSPWHIIPADDKKTMRLQVAQTLVNTLKEMKMSYPEPDEKRAEELKGFISIIEGQN